MSKLEKLVAQARERHLDKDEPVVAAVLGTYDKKIMGEDMPTSGVFIATPERLVFFSKGWFSEAAEVFPLSSISSFEAEKTWRGYRFTFFASGNKVQLYRVQDGEPEKFADFMRGGIGKKAAASQAGPDIPGQIAKLAELRDGGLLSPEEFEAKKRELLARM